MRIKQLKLEFFYLRKAFFEYHRGFSYLRNRYGTAKKVLSWQTPLDHAPTRDDVSVHVLTCHRDMVMLCWSLASYYRVGKVFGELFIHNDGSLTGEDEAIIHRLFPHAQLVDTRAFLDDYKEELAIYPLAREWRAKPKFFLLKKLIDQYFVSQKPLRLVIDSDLLWFVHPTDLEKMFESWQMPSLMIQNNMPAPVFFKDGAAIDERTASFNSGIVLYHRDSFNLDRLTEYLSRVDEADNRNVHFIEQAGFAYCLDKLSALPLEQYHIKGEVTSQTIVKHYTSPRRPLIYIEGIPRLHKFIL